MKYLVRYSIALWMSLLTLSVVSGSDCENKISFWCFSSRIFENLIERLNQSHKPLMIFPGLEIISSASVNDTENMIESGDDSIVGRMTNYLQHHEIKIKLSDLFDNTKLLQFIDGKMGDIQYTAADKRVQHEARKKGDKSYMLALPLMFGKLLAVLGISSIGALAMKALGVASTALLLTVLVGVKSLYLNNGESSHHVQYISDGHHRRRRQIYISPPEPLPLAYRGWKAAAPIQ